MDSKEVAKAIDRLIAPFLKKQDARQKQAKSLADRRKVFAAIVEWGWIRRAWLWLHRHHCDACAALYEITSTYRCFVCVVEVAPCREWIEFIPILNREKEVAVHSWCRGLVSNRRSARVAVTRLKKYPCGHAGCDASGHFTIGSKSKKATDLIEKNKVE